ncbi:MAG: hypothetical protein M1827_001127 [Pycnora praestabilis]|nr:MAG: hypothetical protein M1827_001127 [Pycnora praestabilis]
MGSTTLLTFILQTPIATKTVHLLGSWDNFSKPYVMHADPRTGRGHWRGCHKFENIICDGELTTQSVRRDGGLKMGGTYWYYYQLDGDVEYSDPAQPCTTACPFLPGQPVNILEVPIETDVDFTTWRGDPTSSSHVTTRTLNPEDKYLAPRVVPHPKVPRLCTSTSSLQGLRNQKLLAASEGLPTPVSRSFAPVGNMFNFTRKRSYDEHAARSASLVQKSSIRSTFPNYPGAPRSAGPHVGFERGRSGFFHNDNAYRISSPVLISQTDEERSCMPVPAVKSASYPRQHSFTASSARVETEANPLGSHPVGNPREPSSVASSSPLSSISREPSSLRNVLPSFGDPERDAEAHGGDVDYLALLGNAAKEHQSIAVGQSWISPKHLSIDLDTDRAMQPTHSLNSTVNEQLPDSSYEGSPDPFDLRSPLYKSEKVMTSHFSMSSASTAAFWVSPDDNLNDPVSPALSCPSDGFNNLRSSYHLTSGPVTPSFSDTFGAEDMSSAQSTSLDGENLSNHRNSSSDDASNLSLDGLYFNIGVSRRNVACFGFGSFQGYSLPEEEHASETTIRKASNPVVVRPMSRTGFSKKTDKTVDSWNNRSSQDLSAIEKLVDELGYLGNIIV